MTPEEAEEGRRKLRRAKPEFCNQWNEPPTRYSGERGTVTLQAGCGYPSTWEVRAHGTVDYSCDVHLSQAVRAMTALEELRAILVFPRDRE